MIISKKRFNEELAKAREEEARRFVEREQNEQRQREINDLCRRVFEIERRLDALEGKPQVPITEVTAR